MLINITQKVEYQSLRHISNSKIMELNRHKSISTETESILNPQIIKKKFNRDNYPDTKAHIILVSYIYI